MIFVKNSMGRREVNMIKNKFVKNRVGGRGVNLNLDNVFKYAVFFLEYPLSNEFENTIVKTQRNSTQLKATLSN